MGAQGCVLTPDNKVLLIKHSYRPGWHFPGGGVEKNETALQAVTRELAEEAGIIIEAPPKLHGIFANFRYSARDHVVVFVVRAWRQPVPPQPNREIIAHGFFARDELPSDTSAATKRRLDEILGNETVPEYW